MNRRREIIKRPYFATLEKFLNPCKARIIITSAFHPPYGEKMTTVAERAGFPGSIVVRNGMEGTMAFPLKRAAKILCSARRAHGSYERYEFDFDPTAFLGYEVELEEKLENPSLEKNCQLIEEFLKKGKTSYQLFNDRINVTCAGLKKAIRWVEERIDQ
ncbi:MAG: hypothetical protein NUV91_01755 [Candidatus Omnitrophica bacterium]|nr:hypothetical protein [Candidatus Omnitrophota bacterium]